MIWMADGAVNWPAAKLRREIKCFETFLKTQQNVVELSIESNLIKNNFEPNIVR